MRLCTYYKDIVEKNDNNICGWGPLYYGVLSQVIQQKNFKKVVEVGIGYGTHAKHILKTTDVDTLYLVDPMCFYENDTFVQDILKCEPEIPGNHFNEMYDLIQQELSPWKERVQFIRLPSLSVSDEILKPESIDCVFIDGDHCYDAVYKDLHFWWKKVRPGGQLLGDDFWMESVSRAVNDFAEEMNLLYDFLSKPGSDYKLFRFKKAMV